jgi:hypothetical protein
MLAAVLVPVLAAGLTNSLRICGVLVLAPVLVLVLTAGLTSSKQLTICGVLPGMYSFFLYMKICAKIVASKPSVPRLPCGQKK